MNTTLERAIAKVSELPDEAQERIGLELLDWLAARARLKAEIDIGIKELDAGLGRPLDLEGLIKKRNREHARRR